MAAESDEVGEVSDIDFANTQQRRDRLATAELEASTLIFGRSGGELPPIRHDRAINEQFSDGR
jgi:hypothetical protein